MRGCGPRKDSDRVRWIGPCVRSGSVFFSCVKTKSVRETFFWPFLEFFHAQKIAFTHTFSTFFTHTFLLSRALFLSFQTFHGQFFTFLLFVFFTGTFFLFTGTFFDFFHASIFFHGGKKKHCRTMPPYFIWPIYQLYLFSIWS